MIKRYEHRDVVWIDVENPTQDEIMSLCSELRLPSILVPELVHPSVKPRVEVLPNALFVVLHFPSIRGSRGAAEDQEVDLVIGKNFVMTVHYELVVSIVDYARTFDAAVLINKKGAAVNSATVVFEIMRRLYASVDDELDSIESKVATIETGIFGGEERKMVVPLSNTVRELLNHRRLIGNQAETLRQLELLPLPFLGAKFKTVMATIMTMHYRVYTRAQSLMETLNELRVTNDSLLTTRQNAIMKNLTIVTSIMLPLSLLASVFGMNTANTPIIGSPNDFYVIVLLLTIMGVITAAFFKFLRWF